VKELFERSFMEIRKVTKADDFDAISRIYALSWKAAYRNIVPQQYLDELSEFRWSAVLENSPYDAFVMLENGRYIGTSSICAARDENMKGWGEIISIYLLPEYWGKGAGELLLDNSVTALIKKGYQKIYLWVLEENRRARKFYEKSGFTLSADKSLINIGNKDLLEVRYIYSSKLILRRG